MNPIDSLNGIIVDKSIKDKEKNIEYVDVNSIILPFRERFEDEEGVEFAKLVNSIKENGLLQPVVILKKNNGELIKLAGGRRIKAFKILGKDKIPAIIINENEIDKKKYFELLLTENEERKNLSKIEKVKILIKAFTAYLFPDADITEQKENETIQAIKKIYYLLKQEREYSIEELELLNKWKVFSEKFNVNIHTFFIKDLKVYNISEFWQNLYESNVISYKTLLKSVNIKKKSVETALALRAYIDYLVKKDETDKINEVIEKFYQFIDVIDKTLKKEIELFKNTIDEQFLNEIIKRISMKNMTLILLILKTQGKNFYNDFFEKFKNEENLQNIDDYKNKLIESFNIDELNKLEKVTVREVKKIKKKINKLKKIMQSIIDENDVMKLKNLESMIDVVLKSLGEENENNK